MESDQRRLRGPRKIYGIDFSGAKDAGRKIWIAKGSVADERLVIEYCKRAKDLPDSGFKLGKCLPALREFVIRNQDAAFGMDFPFGLPRQLVGQKSWEESIHEFPRIYKDPDDFKTACFSAAGESELRRKTDIESNTPFSPYNLRLYKQTYFGISEIINPMVCRDLARVLPMQKPLIGKPLIIEICPASTLKTENLYGRYKDGNRNDDRSDTRSHILNNMEKIGPISFQDTALSRTVIEDRNGDALDSVIAAMATYHALKNDANPPQEWKEFWSIEGYVYA